MVDINSNKATTPKSCLKLCRLDNNINSSTSTTNVNQLSYEQPSSSSAATPPPPPLSTTTISQDNKVGPYFSNSRTRINTNNTNCNINKEGNQKMQNLNFYCKTKWCAQHDQSLSVDTHNLYHNNSIENVKFLPNLLLLIRLEYLYIMLCRISKFIQQCGVLNIVPSRTISLQYNLTILIIFIVQLLCPIQGQTDVLIEPELITKSPQSAIQEMNPILRHRFSSKIQERLKLLHESLDGFGNKKRLLRQKLLNGSSILVEEDAFFEMKNARREGGRNCFFSPVQCRLPYSALQTHTEMTNNNNNNNNINTNSQKNLNNNKSNELEGKVFDQTLQAKRNTKFLPTRFGLLNDHNYLNRKMRNNKSYQNNQILKQDLKFLKELKSLKKAIISPKQESILPPNMYRKRQRGQIPILFVRHFY